MEEVKIPPQILRQAEEAGIPPAMLERAAEAQGPEALAALAGDLGATLSDREAQAMFSALQAAKAARGTPGELSDDELEAVSGGANGWTEFLAWLMRLLEMIVKAFGG